jgi:hypothetical protein
MWKKMVDALSAVLVVTPVVCVIWVLVLFRQSTTDRIGLHPTIFGWLPAPIEIGLIDTLPALFGLLWLGVRYLRNFRFLSSWQFIALMLAPALLILLIRALRRVMGAAT